MKRYLKSINLAALLSAIYFSIVWMAYIYLNLTSNVKMTLMFTLFIVGESYFAFDFVTKKLSKMEGLNPSILTRNKKLTIFIVTTVVVFFFDGDMDFSLLSRILFS